MSFDELYLFIREADARRFVHGAPSELDEQVHRDREYVDEGAGPGGSDKGKGFDRVELYIEGKLIASAQCSLKCFADHCGHDLNMQVKVCLVQRQSALRRSARPQCPCIVNSIKPFHHPFG
jgi:hypothetical protein